MELSYDKGLFLLKCHVSDNDLPRRCGFIYDTNLNMWATPWTVKARKVLAACSNQDAALLAIKQKEDSQKAAYALSMSTYSTFEVPCKTGLEFSGYQKAAIQYICERNSVLVADDMGLGKTIEAIGACNVLRPKKVLIVCPATAKLNWKREWLLWTTLNLSVGIATSKDVPDTDVIIINYDITYDKLRWLRSIEWDVVILDEAHLLKNSFTKRSLAIYGGLMKDPAGGKGTIIKPLRAKTKIAMTGTPVLNRPIEIFSTLKWLLPSGFPDRMSFARRYCALRTNGFGWDMTGSSNEAELQAILRSSIMIRRLKPEVLLELPAKRRQIIEVDPSSRVAMTLKKYADFIIPGEETPSDADVLDEDAYKMLVRGMASGARISFEEISAQRKFEAMEALPYVIAHLESCLEQAEKIVCFFHHKEVGRKLAEKFGDAAVMINGDTPVPHRQRIVDQFQNDPRCKLFLGNYGAAGVAITLTAASHIVCAEFPWTPGELTQAEDRCHRRGQKSNVLVQHLVFAGSIGATMLKYIVRKQNIIEKVLNQELDYELMELLK